MTTEDEMTPDEMTLDTFRTLAAEAGLDANDPHLADLYPSVVTLRGVLQKLRAVELEDEEPALVFRPGTPP